MMPKVYKSIFPLIIAFLGYEFFKNGRSEFISLIFGLFGIMALIEGINGYISGNFIMFKNSKMDPNFPVKLFSIAILSLGFTFLMISVLSILGVIHFNSLSY